MSAYSFRPRWWACTLAAAACAAGIALGNWQSGRAAEQRAAVANEKHLELRGEFLERYTVLIDARMNRGRAGYHVVQPLRLVDGHHVLVNRGWVAAPLHREHLPHLRTPPGLHLIEGKVLDHFPRADAPAGAKPEGRVWQNVEVATFAVWSGLKLEPYVLEQRSPLADGLARNWPRADVGVQQHETYALQWYSLAALSALLLLVLCIRAERKSTV